MDPYSSPCIFPNTSLQDRLQGYSTTDPLSFSAAAELWMSCARLGSGFLAPPIPISRILLVNLAFEDELRSAA